MPIKWYVLGPLIALSGGVFGTIAAVAHESGYEWYILSFVAAPIIEEAVKPSGVYLLLAKWPEALPSCLYTAFLSALGGLSFALIENTVYLEVYAPEHTQHLVTWRYGVCLPIHVVCSFIVGFGKNQKLAASVRGEIRFLKGNWPFFAVPIVIHSLYNVVAHFAETQWNWFPESATVLAPF